MTVDNFWLNQGLGFLLGVASGLLAPLVAKVTSRWYHRIRSRLEIHPPYLAAEEIKFFMLDEWSPGRELKPSKVKVEYDEDPWEQDWCDPEELLHLRSGLDDDGGPSSTLRSLAVDHHESEAGRLLHLTFAPSTYGDLIAVGEYFRRHPEEVERTLARLAHDDVASVIAKAPRSVASINVTVTSADGRLLAVRRSGAVRTSQNIWTLGPNETMSAALPTSTGVETPHSLAWRALHEEVGLEPDDVAVLQMSWIGYNVPGALVHLVAHCRSNLRSAEIESRIREGLGSFEVDQMAWLPATPRTIRKIISSVREGRPDSEKRVWLSSAALGAAEWYRWRRVVGA